MKTPEEVHTTRHYGNNMVDVVRPSQSIIYNYTEKLETGHLLNLRVSEVDSGGGEGRLTLALGERMSIHLVF